MKQSKLNLYGVVFIYRPYKNYWEAFKNSGDFITAESGKKLNYDTLKSKNINDLIEYIKLKEY
jgi:hypothetical protein